MRTAVIEDGVVVNITIGGPGVLCPESVNIGHSYVGGEFIAPEPMDPKEELRRVILSEIVSLEETALKPRAMLEALSGDPTFMKETVAKIAILRKQYNEAK